jgi:hypothetical protein
MKYVFLLFLLVLYIVAGPLLLIWSLNTLFYLNILYTFNNWLAAYILMAILSVSIGSNHKTIDSKYNHETSNENTA